MSDFDFDNDPNIVQLLISETDVNQYHLILVCAVMKLTNWIYFVL